MHQRRVARAQHNQVEERVGNQLAFVYDADAKANWLGEESDNIDPLHVEESQSVRNYPACEWMRKLTKLTLS